MLPEQLSNLAHSRRSVLTVPAINGRALEKSRVLDCDAVIFDLEDSVAPERKAEARGNLKRFFAAEPLRGHESIVRINSLRSEFARADMEQALDCGVDAILLPKVEGPEDIEHALYMLSRIGPGQAIRLWAMIETPRGVLHAASIAEYGRHNQGRLDCLVVGLNDLRKATRVPAEPGRAVLLPWLMQVVLAGRAHGVDVIDSVLNDFTDLDAFAAECAQGRAMGFDGKMLIHPAQIGPANSAFGVGAEALAEARAIVAAFAAPEARGLNVVNLDGRMVERLHLEEAQRLIAMAARAARE